MGGRVQRPRGDLGPWPVPDLSKDTHKDKEAAQIEELNSPQQTPRAAETANGQESCVTSLLSWVRTRGMPCHP